MPDFPRQGDVYWHDFAEPRGSEPGFRRPVAVVQADVFNESRMATTLIVPLTTSVRAAREPLNVPIRAGDAGLPRDSIAVVTQVTVVSKADLSEWTGRLSRGQLLSVIRGIHGVLALD
jgi:mRNA interferase MazF